MKNYCKGCGIELQDNHQYWEYCSRSCMLLKLEELKRELRELYQLLKETE